MPRNVKYHGHAKRNGDRNFKRMKSDAYYRGLRKSEKHKSWNRY